MAIFGPGGSNTNGSLQGIRNVRLVSDLTTSYGGRGVAKAYLLNYDFVFKSGVVVQGNDVTLGKESATGQWKFIGDPVNSNQGNNYGVVAVAQIQGLNTTDLSGGGTAAQIGALTTVQVSADQVHAFTLDQVLLGFTPAQRTKLVHHPGLTL